MGRRTSSTASRSTKAARHRPIRRRLPPQPGRANGPTFMWSRDNGSVTLPITRICGSTVSVTTLGRDSQLSVDVGNYVEIVDDACASQGQPGPVLRYAEPLHRVTAVDPVKLTVTLDKQPATAVGTRPRPSSLPAPLGPGRGPRDQGRAHDRQPRIRPSTSYAETWIDLEDGIQVQFSAGTYRAGDYWLIPARVISGNVEWPADPATQQPLALPPMGVHYHLAPLAIVYPDSAVDVRKRFSPLAALPPSSPAPAAGPATTPPALATESAARPPSPAPEPVTPPRRPPNPPRHQASPGLSHRPRRLPDPACRRPAPPSPPRHPRWSVIQVRGHRPRRAGAWRVRASGSCLV